MAIDCNNAKSYLLTKAQYNNLLPAMRSHLHCRRFKDFDEYHFIGSSEQYQDAMRRCAYLN